MRVGGCEGVTSEVASFICVGMNEKGGVQLDSYCI